MKRKDNKKTGENEKKDNADEVGVNSDESTGDTPLVKKKKVKSKIDDDSDVSTGDTPLIKKKKVKSKTDDDSDVSTGDTPLVKKKKVKSKICNDSDVSTGDTPLIKKKKVKSKIDDDSDVSTGDIPLIKKKKVKSKIDDDSENDLASTPTVVKKDKKKTGQQDLSSVDSPLMKKKVKKNTKNSLNDSDIDMGNEVIQKSVDVHKTSVEKDTEKNHISDLNSVKRVKRKRELSDRSNASTSESPDIRRNKKLKRDKTPDKQNDFESEQSDVSTGDTPVVKKALRNSSVHLDKQDVEKEASERVKDDSNSSKNNIDDKESPCSPPEDKENCDNTTDNDSPIKVVKKRGKVKRQLNSCSDEESPIVKPSKQKVNLKELHQSKSCKWEPKHQSDPNIQNDSDNSDDDGDSSDDLPLAQIKHTVKTRVSDLSSDSEDDIPLSKTKAAQSKEVVTTKASKAKKEENVPTSDMAYLRLLRQICRECQMFVRY
ncbi:nucleolar protein dao-5-like [Ruditapes philippinarum]|uniref:nucleolar protein dao-5-like n=1 Tax=Ruditapes philippinarum TaxID=129788 RepID=UPI00295A8FCF|nr:nucleolar protein dao-5-like [Ruditapes philippinarum]